MTACSRPQVAPYGSWTSPITGDMVAAAGISLGQICVDGQDIYWLEGRPAEGGRGVIMRRLADGRLVEMTPAPYNVRSRVHEYGGGAYTVAASCLYFVNYADHGIYMQPSGEPPHLLLAEEGRRFADLVVDTRHRRLICVCEDHSPGNAEPVNTIVSITPAELAEPADPAGMATVQVLVQGSDFYSSPRLSPDGTKLAWLSWNHPNMPWDGCELWLAPVLEDGSLGPASLVAGSREESIFQPAWGPDGSLYFVSDRTGWWNIYRLDNNQIRAIAAGAEVQAEAKNLTPLEAEFGMPQWVFGMSSYAGLDAASIACAYTQQGLWHLGRLDVPSGTLTPLDLPFTTFAYLQNASGRAVMIAGAPDRPDSLIAIAPATGTIEVIRHTAPPSGLSGTAGYLSQPQAVTFPTAGGREAHGFYYPPHNPDYKGPEGERPPLLVMIHGGPTSAANTSLRWAIQFWTSRGFAVLDVNYGGSTGWGRAYRLRLDGLWGIVDVEDCLNGALYLVRQGLADPERLLIKGGSAGGYTALCALTFHRLFRAGASYYGISDLEALVHDTHKFESRYLERLVGPYPAALEIYRRRSPLYHAHLLSSPVIFLQGLEDKVVPPAQAEAMVAALQAKGLTVEYITFPDEGHGFRRSENIKKALEAELAFYGRILGFKPA
ncbi:MAG TPA: S9 family peptidase [Firmicutes bacterium]|nr:S9 family peptidase [Bacillota bacterium]